MKHQRTVCMIRRFITSFSLICFVTAVQATTRELSSDDTSKKIELPFVTNHLSDVVSVALPVAVETKDGKRAVSSWEYLQCELNGYKWVISPSQLLKDQTVEIPALEYVREGKNVLTLQSLGRSNMSAALGWKESKQGEEVTLVFSQIPDSGIVGVERKGAAAIEASSIFFVRPTELVFRSKPVRYPISFEKGVNLTLVGGEAESIQVVVGAPPEGLNNVTVKVVNTTLPEGVISIRKVGFAEINGELWPDPLFPNPTTGITVKAGDKEAWWITVLPSRSVKPGTYEAAVEVRSGGRMVASSTLRLSILGTSLPAILPGGFEIGCPISPQVQKVASPYYFFPNGIDNHNLVPLHRGADGGITPDFQAFDAAVERLRSENRMKRISLGFILGDGQGEVYSQATFHRPVLNPDGTKDTVSFDPTQSPEAKERLRSLLQAYKTHLVEKGWLEDAFLYLWDEPNNKKTRSSAGEYAKIFKELCPEIPLLAVTAPHPDLMSYDIFCPMVNHISDKMYDDARKDGKESWIYSCGNLQHPSLTIGKPGLDSRILGLLAQRYGARNMLHWAVDAGLGNDTRKEGELIFQNVPAEGDGLLFYPPNEPDGLPLSSIRAENMRDAVEDYAIYEMAVNRSPSDSESARFKEDLKLLLPSQYKRGCNPESFSMFVDSLRAHLQDNSL